MSALLSAGCVRITATVVDGAIGGVGVASERPQGLNTLLARHPPAEIPFIVSRLHAVCGVSHALAARAALTAAGAVLDPIDPAKAAIRLAAERLIELLRATVMGFADRVTPRADEIQAVRAILAAGSAIVAGSPADPRRIADALDVLGVAEAPPAASWAGRVVACAAALPWADAGAADVLRPDDDCAVVDSLLAAGDAFAARPRLPGRRPQTGPFARSPRRDPSQGGGGRLSARFKEIKAALRRLGAPTEDHAPWWGMGTLAPGLGFAAVESPRGRLYHLVALDGEGAVARYHILAPTEWTFAPDGPVAAALPSLRLHSPDEAETMIGRLAALFDPCVACEIALVPALVET